MSNLVVLDFDGVGTADEVLTKLRGMQKEYLIDLEDACVVVHTDTGKVQVKQAVNLTSLGAASGASTGMLIGALAGLLVLNPLAGMGTPLRSVGRAWRCAGRGELRQIAGALDERHRARCGETPDHHLLARKRVRPEPRESENVGGHDQLIALLLGQRFETARGIHGGADGRVGVTDGADDQGADIDPHVDPRARRAARKRLRPQDVLGAAGPIALLRPTLNSWVGRKARSPRRASTGLPTLRL